MAAVASRGACCSSGGHGDVIMAERDLFGGLYGCICSITLSHEAIFGMGILDGLAHHGYKLSAAQQTTSIKNQKAPAKTSRIMPFLFHPL